jgi:hypothetical protein
LGLVNEEPKFIPSQSPLQNDVDYLTKDVLSTDGLLGGNAIDAYLDDNI